MRFYLLLLMFFQSGAIMALESTCFGTTKNGRLENGVKLPSSGNNFVSYGTIPILAGRTYVHNKVRDVIIEAYHSLEYEQPGKVFKYAETGYKSGGTFKPHKTHQNGLSVDLIVPVFDSNQKSVHLPTHPLNKYGYDIEFDNNGTYKNYRIDFEALGALIISLHKAATTLGIDIWRVIFSPDLQPLLYSSKYGAYIKENIYIPSKHSWVRHDEHIHIDFNVKCK